MLHDVTRRDFTVEQGRRPFAWGLPSYPNKMPRPIRNAAFDGDGGGDGYGN
jgi:hypothetical protein